MQPGILLQFILIAGLTIISSNADQVKLAQLNQRNDRYMIDTENVLWESGQRILRRATECDSDERLLDFIYQQFDQTERQLLQMREVNVKVVSAVLGDACLRVPTIVRTFAYCDEHLAWSVADAYAQIARNRSRYSETQSSEARLGILRDAGREIVHIVREYAWDVFRNTDYLRAVLEC